MAITKSFCSITVGRRERQQVGECIRVFLGLGDGSILVKGGDDANPFGHHVFGLEDHVITLRQLGFGEVGRVALVARGYHLVPERRNLRSGLYADLMATAAALHSLGHRHRLVMKLGMAFMAAHAAACLLFLYCATLSA